MGYELRSVRLYEVGKELVAGFVGLMIADGFGTLRSTQRRRLTLAEERAPLGSPTRYARFATATSCLPVDLELFFLFSQHNSAS